MRVIDADELKKALKEHFSDEDDDVELIEIGACWYHGAVLEKIDNAPTVDAVEVVRCKDCKWYDKPYCEVYREFDKHVADNDFCSLGETHGKHTETLFSRRQFVIMCGGYYEHFDKPKALMEVYGEPIVKRTIRLLMGAGVSDHDIHISATDERFKQFGVDVLEHNNTYRYENGEMKGYWLDAFYPHFPNERKVTFLYGDVVYTQEAINTIVHCKRKGNILFGSSLAKNEQHKNWGEPFAYKVDDYKAFLIGIGAVKIMYDEGKLKRHPITWELYRFLNGLDINVQAVRDETYICIDDGTHDIDAPEEIEE